MADGADRADDHRGVGPLLAGDPSPLIHFAGRHGISLDWLVCGDLRGVLLSASKTLKARRAA